MGGILLDLIMSCLASGPGRNAAQQKDFWSGAMTLLGGRVLPLMCKCLTLWRQGVDASIAGSPAVDCLLACPDLAPFLVGALRHLADAFEGSPSNQMPSVPQVADALEPVLKGSTAGEDSLDPILGAIAQLEAGPPIAMPEGAARKRSLEDQRLERPALCPGCWFVGCRNMSGASEASLRLFTCAGLMRGFLPDSGTAEHATSCWC
ncbi:hypothetical protein WJX81_008457 [Elliptochloris bilobata]|uniref:Uncharacterized protein n=1 Tax=Elliptochloris bilobata TaxID=381761 RepID=A0AAW1SA86_9CHLO